MTPDQIGAAAAYTVTHFGVGATYEQYLWCLRRLPELGFRHFNLEILEDQHEAMFSPEAVDSFRNVAQEVGLGLEIFTAYYAGNDLASIDPPRRRRGVEKFRYSAGCATRLGSAVINIAAEFPPELVEAYRPEYEHSPAGAFHIPREVSWNRIWDGYVEAIRQCAEIAADHGLKFSLEPRANCIISTADSFLRLADHVGHPSLGCSIDLMHACFHREDLPTAIKKLGSLLIDVQVCDADGQTLRHLPIGKGMIDFGRLLAALDDIGFAGIIGLEVRGDDIDESYRTGRIALEEFLAGKGSIRYTG